LPVKKSFLFHAQLKHDLSILFKKREKMKKLIIAIFALVLFQSQSLKAEGFYTGAKASQLKIKFDTVEGIDLGKIYEEDYSLLDFHIGYGISNSLKK
jgi:hypothetical protein